MQQLCEFQIDETYRISETGVVVGGLLTKGIITEGAKLSLGEMELEFSHAGRST